MKGYVNFPLSLAFFTINQASNPHFKSFSAVKLIPYDKLKINDILNNVDLHCNFGRILLKLGMEPKGRTYGDPDTEVAPDVIFARVGATAKRNSVILSQEEIKAIFAFSCSVAGETQQGGMFKVLDNTLTHLLNLLQCSLVESDTTIHHELQIDKPINSNQIRIVNTLSCSAIASYQPPKSGLFEKPKSLVFKKNNFLITPVNIDNTIFYNLQPLETDADCKIEENLWKNHLVPAALTYLNNIQEMHPKDFLLMPFLMDVGFRNAFCEKLAKQSKSIQKLALAYIEACFVNDVLTKNSILSRPEIQTAMLDKVLLSITEMTAVNPLEEKELSLTPSSLTRSLTTPTVSTSYQADPEEDSIVRLEDRDFLRVTTSVTDILPPPAPAEKVLPIEQILMNAFQAAKDRLIELIQNDSYNAQNRQTAKLILDDIIKIPPQVENNNLVLLTSVLERTATAVKTPDDIDNLVKFQGLLQPVKIRNWLKLASGMAFMLLGAALVVVATAVAVASFGATSLLTSWGLIIGSSILVKALSIAVGVGGACTLTGGFLLANDRPLAGLAAHSSSLWRSPHYNLPSVVENNSILPAPAK